MTMLKQTIAVTMACAACAWCMAAPQLTGGLQFGFMSQAPKFARINLTDSGDKWLLVVFDESGGTDAGYDYVHLVPQGFKGATLNVKATGGKNVPAAFSPLKLTDHVAAAEVRGGMAQYLSALSFVISNVSSFTAHVYYRARVNGVTWEYRVGAPLETSDKMDKVPTLAVTVKPSLALDVKTTGVTNVMAVGISAALTPAVCTVNGLSPELFVVVKTLSGTVVRRITTTADKLAATPAGEPRCVVPVMRQGTYVVEATINTGPLGGEMRVTKRAEVPPRQMTVKNP